MENNFKQKQTFLEIIKPKPDQYQLSCWACGWVSEKSSVLESLPEQLGTKQEHLGQDGTQFRTNTVYTLFISTA